MRRKSHGGICSPPPPAGGIHKPEANPLDPMAAAHLAYQEAVDEVGWIWDRMKIQGENPPWMHPAVEEKLDAEIAARFKAKDVPGAFQRIENWRRTWMALLVQAGSHQLSPDAKSSMEGTARRLGKEQFFGMARDPDILNEDSEESLREDCPGTELPQECNSKQSLPSVRDDHKYEEAYMSLILTAEDSPPPLDEGIYNATFTSIEECSNAKGPFLKWIFSVSDNGEERAIVGVSSTHFTPKSKTRQWTEAILARPVESGEKVDLESLYGKRCRLLLITTELDDGREVNRIDKLLPVKSKKTQKEMPEDPDF